MSFALLVALAACAYAGGAKAAPRTSEVFFDLHQAVGFLEAYEGGRCASGLGKATVYLNMARDGLRKAPSAELAAIADRLRSLTESSDSDELLEVEKLRQRLHALGTSKGYRHSDSWNQEFWNCRG